MNLMQQAEKALDDAIREHRGTLVAERAARAKVKAAETRFINLQFSAMEADLEIARMRREGELR